MQLVCDSKEVDCVAEEPDSLSNEVVCIVEEPDSVSKEPGRDRKIRYYFLFIKSRME